MEWILLLILLLSWLPQTICGHLLCWRQELWTPGPFLMAPLHLWSVFLQKPCPTVVSCCEGEEAVLSCNSAARTFQPADHCTACGLPLLSQLTLLFIQKFPMTSWSIKFTLYMWSQRTGKQVTYSVNAFVRLLAVFNSSCVVCNQNRNRDAERLVFVGTIGNCVRGYFRLWSSLGMVKERNLFFWVFYSLCFQELEQSVFVLP